MQPILPGDMMLPLGCGMIGFMVGMAILLWMRGAFS